MTQDQCNDESGRNIHALINFILGVTRYLYRFLLFSEDRRDQ